MRVFMSVMMFVFLVFSCTMNASGQVIRCADPDCPICLAVPGMISPKVADTREPRNWPEDAPFGRDASLAVVNPLVRSPYQSIISLRGDWEFVTDPDAVGLAEKWMQPEQKWKNSRTMPVPGNWETHGCGEPGMGVPWLCDWDCVPRPMRHIYFGSAWYRTKVEVPDNWNNRRVWLKVGGLRAQGWLWINGEPVAHVTNYCGAFKFEITDLVKPGETATIVALVRNDVPSRTGNMSACHLWGGFSRDVEIEATPEIYLDNVVCGGDFDNRQANIHLEIGHSPDDRGKTVNVKCVLRPLDLQNPQVAVEESGASHSFQIVLGEGTKTVVEERVDIADFRPWSPETPNLYRATVELLEGENPQHVAHGWVERFGVKKFEVRGDRFYLNDKPYFLRGYGDDYIYPLTFISPVDRDAHRHNLRIAKKSGFNYVRHHTHCEIPEHYDMADELGIMIQPELPYYPFNGHHTTELFDFDPKRDLNEVIDHYRRHVSLSTYSMGNEGHLGTPIDNELKQLVKQRDPGRLVLHNDGGRNTKENSDFFTGPIMIWEPGTFRCELPYVAHEYLNLGLKFDPRISERFTGVILPPQPIDEYEKRLDDIGLDRKWGDACLDAGHALQKYYQKLGIESARRDPTCDGYSFWTIIDVIVKSGDFFTGQGLYNAFWEPKFNGTTPDDFAKFNGPTAILMKPDRETPILVSGETVRLKLMLSHFGYDDIRNGRLFWKISDSHDVVAEGTLDHINAATGDVREIGVAEFVAPRLNQPKHLNFSVRLENADVTNDWDFWAFPGRQTIVLQNVAVTPELWDILSARYDGLLRTGTPEGDSANLVIGTMLGPMIGYLEKGQKVMLIGPADGEPNVKLGWWSIGEQTGTAFARHAAFGDFPHDGLLGPLWFRLIKRGMPIQKDGSLRKAEYLSVGEGRDEYYLYAAQAIAGENGKVLITQGLDLLDDTPEGTYLLDQMIRYAESGAFQPQGQMDCEKYLEKEQLREIVTSHLNGWNKTLESPLHYFGENYYGGPAMLQSMKFDAKNQIVWETKPVAPIPDDEETYTFHWMFGIGFIPNRPLEVRLAMNDKPLVTFKIDINDESWTVKEDGVILEYRRLAYYGNESTGLMSLTVPKDWVVPGGFRTLRLENTDLGFSDSWVGIFEK